MRDLRKGIRDYLMLRRGLGFQLVKHEARLAEFASFLERRGSARITSELAVEWAKLPVDCQPCYWTARLSSVRGVSLNTGAPLIRSQKFHLWACCHTGRSALARTSIPTRRSSS